MVKSVKKKRINSIIHIFLWIVLVLVVVFVFIYPYLKFKKEMYCHVESSMVYDDLNLDQCVNMNIVYYDEKVISNVLKDFERYEVYECTDKYSELPVCYGGVPYYAEYTLKSLCTGECDIDGRVCAEYYVVYHNFSDRARSSFESKFIGLWDGNVDDLTAVIKKCDGKFLDGAGIAS